MKTVENCKQRVILLLLQLMRPQKNVGALMAQGKKEEAEKLKTEVASRKEQSKDYLHKIAAIENEVYESLVRLPNLPHSSVPTGKIPEENEVVRQYGVTPDLSAQKLAHWDIAAKYSLIDFLFFVFTNCRPYHVINRGLMVPVHQLPVLFFRGNSIGIFFYKLTQILPGHDN